MRKRKHEKADSQEFMWSLWTKRFDSKRFFSQAPALLDGSEVVFLEGTCIAKEAQKLYKSYECTTEYLPAKGIIWPSSKTYSCKATASFFQGLENLADNHAEPELFTHFHVYKGNHRFLEWWDAFSDPIFLSGSVSEGDVYNFAATMGLKVEKFRLAQG